MSSFVQGVVRFWKAADLQTHRVIVTGPLSYHPRYWKQMFPSYTVQDTTSPKYQEIMISSSMALQLHWIPSFSSPHFTSPVGVDRVLILVDANEPNTWATARILAGKWKERLPAHPPVPCHVVLVTDTHEPLTHKRLGDCGTRSSDLAPQFYKIPESQHHMAFAPLPYCHANKVLQLFG